MSKDPSEAIGRGIALLLMIGLAVTYFCWGSIVRVGADHSEGDIALWVYDADAERGGTIDAKVRVDNGDRVRINSITVDGAGERQSFGGAGQSWGNTIEVRENSVPDDASAVKEFTIRLPEDADSAHLVIRVSTTAALNLGRSFYNDNQKAEFLHEVALHGAAGSRRAMRIAGAFALLAAIVGLLVAVRRRFQRRGQRPNAIWLVLLLPYAMVGYLGFAKQLALGLHIHGVLFGLLGMVVWFVALALPGRITGPLGLRPYRVEPEKPADVATVTLESEWIANGMGVTRRGRWLYVGIPGAEPARVRIPGSETFGREPFEIEAPDRATVEAMLVGAARHLGTVRCTRDGEAELRI